MFKNNMQINCWVVTEGLAGTENQCLGVADALGISPEIKRIALRAPWNALSPWLGFEQASTFVPPLQAPWPDILLASGRKSVAASRYIKKASLGKTFTVQIQDPRISPAHFDLVAVPAHDPTRGDNVLVTDAAPNRITLENLESARLKFPDFGNYVQPRVAVLLGGNSKAHQFTSEIARRVTDQLAGLNASLMITASRRTGEENLKLIQQRLSGPNRFIWDGTGENPYMAMLAWSDYILVTEDSVSMISDAATAGKPVYVIKLEGGGGRLDKFHRHLQALGITRPFEGRLEQWNYQPLRDSDKIADAIRSRLKIPPAPLN